MRFFIYLLECYAEHKGLPSGEVLRTWDDHDLTAYIFDNYWNYHTEDLSNAFADIDSMLKTGTPAW